MATISRTIRRGIIFRAMNKQQRQLWRDAHKGHRKAAKKKKR